MNGKQNDSRAASNQPREPVWARAARLVKAKLARARPAGRDLDLALASAASPAPDRHNGAGELADWVASPADDPKPQQREPVPATAGPAGDDEQARGAVLARAERAPDAPARPAARPREGATLDIYVLGTFRVYQNDVLVEKWPGIKCRAILKYLVAHRDKPVAREVLIEQFWAGSDPEAARRNLHQAVYNLRRALRKSCTGCSHIVFEDGAYRLEPGLDVWIDAEAFQQHYKEGQRLEQESRLPEAVAQYELAASLYGGDFLAEDVYEDWSFVQRESLKLMHLDILDRLSRHYLREGQWAMCITLCHRILAEDNCREDAHRRLMRCYYRQGHRHLSLRQYHLCVDALRRELDVEPMPATVDLFRQMQASGNQLSKEKKLRKK